MQGLRDVGSYIREQRETAKISLRQLSERAGVSNPYLSQIERGLRKPSAEILQQIAKALQISAEVLYVQAGILDERKGGAEVVAAIRGDSRLTERQKHVLLEIYESFCRETAPQSTSDGSDLAPPVVLAPAAEADAADAAGAAGAAVPAVRRRRAIRPVRSTTTPRRAAP